MWTSPAFLDQPGLLISEGDLFLGKRSNLQEKRRNATRLAEIEEEGEAEDGEKK